MSFDIFEVYFKQNAKILLSIFVHFLLSYRVDRSEHTLLRATADVIDRYATTFQAMEVVVCTWHRISRYPGTDSMVRSVMHLASYNTLFWH